eukprot:1242553-Alexandrium_andersonii.AAC.1
MACQAEAAAGALSAPHSLGPGAWGSPQGTLRCCCHLLAAIHQLIAEAHAQAEKVQTIQIELFSAAGAFEATRAATA